MGIQPEPDRPAYRTDAEAGRALAVVNWTLMILALPVALVIGGIGYSVVAATDRCAYQLCPADDPGQTALPVLWLAAPVVTIAAIFVSLATAKRGSGCAVSVGVWLLISVAGVTMLAATR